MQWHGPRLPAFADFTFMIILDIFYLESYPINFITHSLFFDTLFWTGLSLGLNNKGSLSPPKTDEFPENFRTAFAPPPRPFFGKFHCDFFRKFITKITVSNAKKIAMKFFGSEMTPPPPFGNFPEIHSNPGRQASLTTRATRVTTKGSSNCFRYIFLISFIVVLFSVSMVVSICSKLKGGRRVERE